MWAHRRHGDEDREHSDDASSQAESYAQSSRRLAAPSVLSTTSSSSRSLNSTFSALEADDIDFFDQLIASLPLGNASFASLKASYVQLRQEVDLKASPDRDVQLWNTLLSLVKVRGRDWSERWDTVRVGLGLEMREADLSDVSSLIDRGRGPTDDESQTAESQTQWTQETSQSEGSDADNSSQSSDDGWTASAHSRRHDNASFTSSATTVGGHVGSSSSSHRTLLAADLDERKAEDLAALKARMELLTRQAGALTVQVNRAVSPRAWSKSRVIEEPSSESPATSPVQEQDGFGNAYHSSSGEEGTSPRQPNLAQRRLDMVLSSNRPSLREAAQRRAEESEEQAWSRSARLAEEHHEVRLTSNCFTWWYRLQHRQSGRIEQANEVRDRRLVSQSFQYWKSLADDDVELTKTASHANHIRSILSPWRIWRRKTTEKRNKVWEAKKSELRGLYTAMKQTRSTRLLRDALTQWRQRLLDSKSLDFRNGHLLGGAFFLWRMQLDVSQALGGPKSALVRQKEVQLKETVLDRWRKTVQMSTALRGWQEDRSRRCVSQAFQLWSKMTTLTAIGRTYSVVRLQRSTMQTWLQRLAESSMNKRRQLQADRMCSRWTTKKAVKQWRQACGKLQDSEAAADSFREQSQRSLVRRSVARWRTESRGRLLTKVKEGRLLKICTGQWQVALRRATVILPAQARAMANRKSSVIQADCLDHWRARLRFHREAETVAYRTASSNLLKDVVKQWHSAHSRRKLALKHAQEDHERSMLRKTLLSMRSRVLARRLREFQEGQQATLLRRSFHSWRARKNRQEVDRLAVAHIQSRITLRMERETLRVWTQRVVDRRFLLFEVNEAHKEKTMSQALAHWHRSYLRVREQNSLGESFQDIKREESQRRIVHLWVTKSRKNRSLRERGDQLAAQRDERIVSQAFGKWYDDWREDNIRDLEYELALRRQEDAKRKAMTQWIQSTKPLPAIRLHHQRLKEGMFERWRDRLPLAIDVRRAVETDHETLLSKALYHWLDECKGKRARRAAARFGGPSMARLSRHSSRHSSSPFKVVRPRRSTGSRSIDGQSSPRIAPSSPLPSIEGFAPSPSVRGTRAWDELSYDASDLRRPVSEAGQVRGSALPTTLTEARRHRVPRAMSERPPTSHDDQRRRYPGTEEGTFSESSEPSQRERGGGTFLEELRRKRREMAAVEGRR